MQKRLYPNPKKAPRALIAALVLCLLSLVTCFAEEGKLPEQPIITNGDTEEGKPPEQPIIVNGDTVEYSTSSQQVTAQGNVEVDYKGAKLTCEKLTVNTQTKEGLAEGNARLDDKQGVIEGKKISYNFQTKKGTIIDAEFRANPYFGRAEKINKVSDAQFIALRGYATTCDLDHPHYRIGSKRVNFFPGDKIQTKDDIFYIGDIPVFTIPQYNHSLKDPLMHVQIMPGKSKDWGPYILTGWRYNLTEHLNGRIYLDYRDKLGVAEGVGANYLSENLGKGDFKFYYTQERTRGFPQGEPAEFERYLIRWLHKWTIDPQTNITAEYWKIVDSKRANLGTEYLILKDFFPREYEKDDKPLSYVFFHHAFDYGNIDFIMQKRTNRWYTQLEKLPEIQYSLPTYRIGQTPFYWENNTQIANYNQKNAVPSPSTADLSMERFDMTNKFSLPMRVAFINLNPFLKNRETYYDDNVYGASIPPRSIFYAGAEASTKFYRIFNLKTNFLGLDINNLRHIITPSVNYSYNHRPSILNTKLKQIDSVDAITNSNTATLELSNKLQTKRMGESVDLVDFLIKSSYTFKPRIVDNEKEGGSLSDFSLDLKLLPYSWMRIESTADYNYAKQYFSQADYDVTLDFGNERSFGFGQRYELKGGNEVTYKLDWRFNPKWKLSVYQRYQKGHDPTLKRGLREQEYTLTRDLHCWSAELTYNVQRGKGEAVWLVFRIKAFPENEFGFNREYHQPKPGSQSNP